jgi:hypothetical protein
MPSKKPKPKAKAKHASKAVLVAAVREAGRFAACAMTHAPSPHYVTPPGPPPAESLEAVIQAQRGDVSECPESADEIHAFQAAEVRGEAVRHVVCHLGGALAAARHKRVAFDWTDPDAHNAEACCAWALGKSPGDAEVRALATHLRDMVENHLSTHWKGVAAMAESVARTPLAREQLRDPLRHAKRDRFGRPPPAEHLDIGDRRVRLWWKRFGGDEHPQHVGLLSDYLPLWLAVAIAAGDVRTALDAVRDLGKADPQ